MEDRDSSARNPILQQELESGKSIHKWETGTIAGFAATQLSAALSPLLRGKSFRKEGSCANTTEQSHRASLG
jgi:hypothetical protein